MYGRQYRSTRSQDRDVVAGFHSASRSGILRKGDGVLGVSEEVSLAQTFSNEIWNMELGERLQEMNNIVGVA